jgi:hypothetical protein
LNTKATRIWKRARLRRRKRRMTKSTLTRECSLSVQRPTKATLSSTREEVMASPSKLRRSATMLPSVLEHSLVRGTKNSSCSIREDISNSNSLSTCHSPSTSRSATLTKV